MRCIEAAADAKETKPPPRYSEATLLSAMEAAGKLIEDEELREAMKDSGIGTPATRAAIIEPLIDAATSSATAGVCSRPEGHPGHRPAGRAQAHVPEPDRRLGAPPADIEQRAAAATAFMRDIATFTDEIA